MSLFSIIRMAVEALLVRKSRSALTSLGIVIGIAAVIGMVSAGDGARTKLDERLDSVGKNLILIRPGAYTSSGSIADFALLHSDDADALRKQLGSEVVGVAELQVSQRIASTGVHHWMTLIVGCTPDYKAVRQWSVASGRFLMEDDVKKQSQVCLLGQTTRQKLFPNNPDPVGQMVRVDRLQLRVIGVLASKGHSPTGADQDDQIFMPITTLQHKLVGEERVTMILTAPRPAYTAEHVKKLAIKVLRLNHRVKAGNEDFDVSTVSEMAAIAVVVTTTMRILIAIIAGISLVVGGIGIMNIMLVSVTERTREIGIRMAVGAAPANILLQFLVEAITLAVIGGIVGIGLGILAAIGMARAADWPVVISGWIVAIAFAVSAAVGVFFGYYPAMRAARMDPIEALRHE